MKTHCTLVIGHVDHGKTALVRALTGIETDRLEEEKLRGLSITAGYAHHSYPTGTLDFIDAPGHENFIQSMVAGATGAKSVLIVISAVEGVKAQTLEHLCIAELLGIQNGIIAVSKSDLIDPAIRAEQQADIEADLAHTPFANLPLIWCSAQTTEGIDTLHLALESLLSLPDYSVGPLQTFLPIDRVFTLSGHGTVVTGTLSGRSLEVGSEAIIMPQERRVSIRGLQSRGVKSDLIHSGERTAANLRGVSVNEVKRGNVLCRVGSAAPSRSVDVIIAMLPQSAYRIRHNEDIRVLFGTSSEVASLRLYGGGQLGPGQAGLAQLRFKKPVVGFAGQRAVLGRLSPSSTLGGAVFLDPQATPTPSGDAQRVNVLVAAQARDVPAIAYALAQACGGAVRLSDVARIARLSPEAAGGLLGADFAALGSELVASHADIDACKSIILATLASYHARFPLHTAAPRTVIARNTAVQALFSYVEKALLDSGSIRLCGAGLALSNYNPVALLTPQQSERIAQIEDMFSTADLSPPPRKNVMQDGADQDLLQLCIDLGRLTALRNVSLNQTLVFHTDALVAAAARLRAAFAPPQSFTAGEARTALGTSRKVIVPVLEYFDAQGITVRTADARQMSAQIQVPPPLTN